MPGNSTINIDALSLGEDIPLVGMPFSLHYESSRFRSSSFFPPKTLGLGGWTPSLVHHYDAAHSILYTGDGGLRNIAALPLPEGGGVYVTNVSGSEVYTFDGNGRHLHTLHSLTGSPVYSFSYDGSGRLASVVDAFGNTTSVQHSSGSVLLTSPYGQATQLALDGGGYLASVTNPKGEAHQLTHTSSGLLTAFQKPGGQVSQFTYDSDGFLLKDQGAGGNFIALLRSFDAGTHTQQVQASTALNRTTQYTTVSSSSSQSNRSVQYPEGSLFQSSFQAEGTDQSQDAFGGSTSSSKAQDPRFGWLAPFSQSFSYSLPGSGINLSVETSKTAELSDSGNPLSLTRLLSSNTLQGSRVFTSEYTQSNRSLVSRSAMGRTNATVINTAGQPVSVKVGALTPVNFQYDARGRLSQVSQGARSMFLAYDAVGNLATNTDFLGKTTSFQYDEAGRVTRQFDAHGQAIAFTYDANGNLTSLTPPGKTAHSFAYNLFERTESYLPPSLGALLSGATTFGYNLDRQLTDVHRADGKEIHYEYGDSTGLLNSIQTSDGNYNLSYYSNSSLLHTLVSPDQEQLSYEYFGNRLEKATSSGPVSGEVAYSYLSDGNLGSIAVNGASISLGYDQDGLLTQAGAMSLARNAEGAVSSTVLKKVREDLSYDTFGQLRARSVKIGNLPAFTRNFERDTMGRIVRISGPLSRVFPGLGGQAFSYDSLGRLTKAQGVLGAREYQYDANGNRLSVRENGVRIQGAYDAQDRLVKYGSTRYEYNANGDLEKKIEEKLTRERSSFWNRWFSSIWRKHEKATEYEYDVFGNLQKVTLPDGKLIEYVIDGQNRRVGKKVNGTLVQGFLYQSQTQVAAELDGSGRVVKRFIYGSKSNSPDYMLMSGKEYRILSNHVGTPELVVEAASGKVVEALVFDEFGRPVFNLAKKPLLPFGFAGGIHDHDTGLVRFGARDYDPETGRWTAKDPIGFAGGDSNLYGYVLQDPVNGIDENGKNPFVVAVVAGAAVGAISNIIGSYLAGTLSQSNFLTTAAIGATAGAVAVLASGALGIKVGTVTVAGLLSAEVGSSGLVGAFAGALVDIGGTILLNPPPPEVTARDLGVGLRGRPSCNADAGGQ